MMTNGLEAAIQAAGGRAKSELGRLKIVMQKVQGQPVEQWSLAAVVSILNSAVTFLGETHLITKLGTQAAADEIMSKLKTGWIDALEYVIQTGWLNEEITAVDRERLIQAKKFYEEFLGNYSTIGQVAEAIRKRELPPIMVADAAPTAYLHAPVRNAIEETYGLKTLERPRR
ncbi:hypothetical protein HYV83_03850 [Candidatus Woesearchaeota archaeon]|nr:hypothetical protein [Candidatus Woesearchaeota archaeon]